MDPFCLGGWECEDMGLEIIQMSTRNQQHIEQGGSGGRVAITQAALHPNQVEVTTADVEGRVRTWNVGMRHCSHEVYECTSETSAMRSVSVSESGRMIAAVNDKVEQWDELMYLGTIASLDPQ